MTLREQLLEMAEPAYRDFTMPLMPGVEHVIGIRVPKLRLLAREIVRGDWRSYLDTAEDLYFEERLLQGLVIGLAKCDPAEKLRRVARFVPKIDNWACAIYSAGGSKPPNGSRCGDSYGPISAPGTNSNSASRRRWG